MDQYFTIMIKENDTSNLKLLTEKLGEGFWINDRIEVGRSTVLTLRKAGERRNNRSGLRNYLDVDETSIEPMSIGGSILSSGTDTIG